MDTGLTKNQMGLTKTNTGSFGSLNQHNREPKIETKIETGMQLVFNGPGCQYYLPPRFDVPEVEPWKHAFLTARR